MSRLGEELVLHHAAIADRWYEAWRRSPHPSEHVGEEALKHLLPEQLRLIGEQLATRAPAEEPSRMWSIAERLEPEKRIGEQIPIEELVKVYAMAVDVVRDWISERDVQVSFDEYTYFFDAMFELTAESVRRYSVEQAKRVREDRARYLAGVMHQLRTPLFVVSMAAELLDSRPESSRPREQLQRGLRRMQSLIDGVLRLERYEPEQLPLHPEELDIAAKTAEVVRDYAHDARRKGISLEVRVDPSLSACLDPDLFVDALGNLVQNAVKYTASGSVQVEGAAQDGLVLLRVRDSGPGMDEEQLRGLFDEAQPGREGGAGIGLLIACRGARAMGGSIEAESAPGRGSVFSLRLPRHVAPREG